MNTKNLLREEIHSEIEELGKMQVGTDTYDKTVSGVTKLVDKLNDMEKLENEKNNFEVKMREIDLENEKLKSENKDRKVKNSLTAVGLGITVVGGIAMFVFEEKGTIVVSQAGRKVVDRIFRTK